MADSCLGGQGSQSDNTTRLKQIKWAALNDRLWKDFEEDLDCILEQAATGPAGKKLKTMTGLIYAVGKERFGIASQNARQDTGCKKKGRQLEIERLRKQLRNLRKKYREAAGFQKIGLLKFRDHHRSRLQDLRKAQRIRKARREKAKQRARFLANPYGFIKEVLEEKRTGQLQCSREEVEAHLKGTHSDDARHTGMPEHERIVPVPTPTAAFDQREPTLKEVQDVVKK